MVRRVSRFAHWRARLRIVWPRPLFRPDAHQVAAFKRLTLTALSVALFVYLLKMASLLEGVEMRWLDFLAYLDRPAFREPVTVVGITEEDFHSPQLFRGIAPLDPAVLSRILERVAAHRPRAVLVDIQIHPAPWETPERVSGRMQLYATLHRIAHEAHVPVILARDPDAEPELKDLPDSLARAWAALVNDHEIHWSDPLLWTSEGVVRSASRWTMLDGHVSERPSLLGSTIQALDLKPREEPAWYIEEEHPHEPWQIRFSGHFIEDTTAVSPTRLSAGVLLSSSFVPGQRNLLTDRIALVGGLYPEGRDTHLTPVGEMAGVYVWAEAIASWIRHDALREPPEWIALLLECIVGVLTGLLLLRYGPGFGLLWSLLAIVPLTIVFSMLTFGDRVLFLNFLPSFFAVYVHYQVELHLVIRELRHHALDQTREVKRLRRRLNRLRSANETPTPEA